MAVVINRRKTSIFIQLRNQKSKPIYSTGFTIQTEEPIEQVKDKLIAFCKREVK